MKWFIYVIGGLLALSFSSCNNVKLAEELELRNDLTEKIITNYPIPYTDPGPASQVGQGLGIKYLSVHDALTRRGSVDVSPGLITDMEAMREQAKREMELRKKFDVKPNPDYIAEGVTAVLEIYHGGGVERIKNGLSYIIVNDKNELTEIQQNINDIGTIIVLQRYNANSGTYSADKNAKTGRTLTQEGMAIYFYDCIKQEVFENFTILATPLLEKYVGGGSNNFVTNHVETINNKLKTDLKGNLSFRKIISF